MTRREAHVEEVKPCENCSAAIIKTPAGWQHIRVGVTLSGAHGCVYEGHKAAPRTIEEAD